MGIIYAVIGLHNFIKIHQGYEKDIYNAPMDNPDNTKVENKGRTQKSDFTQMNSMRDKMADQM